MNPTGAVVLACWLVLFAVQMLWWAWLAGDPPLPRALLVAVAAGPLLLPLRGLLHDRPRSYFWFNLLLLPYFAFGVAALYASGGLWLWWLQVGACLIGFTAGFLRTRG